MATYKGISFPDTVAPLARHMPSVNDHREALAALSATWDTLGLLAHLSNLKADMREVRVSFGELTGELLACLAEETLALARETLGHQARIAIDVLTRNLFERTADVGFLATDAAIVSACLDRDPARLAALRERLRAYAARYTVYSDIVLLGPDGRVLTRLVDGFAGWSGSSVIGRALDGQGGWVETYEATDFCGGALALTHAWRVEHEGRAVGVLALVFDLEREAALVFDRLAREDGMIAFVDARDRVLLSNDATRLPAGRRVTMRPDAASLRLGGVTHVAARRAGQAYQGYPGPGWAAIALAPVELAFGDDAGDAAPVAFSGENVFSQRLRDVPVRAREIQRRLDRMVWNGRIHQASESSAFSRSLLEEIAATGRRTKDQFERASSELLATVASGLQSEARFLAELSVDILARSLYERANDIRWWAADPVLAMLDAGTARATLARLNGLYTVYANLLVFDAQGVVIAASRDAGIEGRTLASPWVAECLALRDPMRCAVSPFESGALHDAGTWVFAAPLLVDGRAVGGVAAVFDATPQVEAMLREALPAAPGSVAAFCLRDGHVVGRTGELHVTLPASVLALAPGQSWSGLLMEAGRCFIVGATATSGYREFRHGEDGVEPVVGVVVIPCGQAVDRHDAAPPLVANAPDGVEVATFLIGEQLLGVQAREVVECIEVTAAVRVWRGGFARRHVGFVTWNGMALPLVDIAADVGVPGAAHRHAIVLRAGAQAYGLLVSDLGPVADMKLGEERGLTGQGELTRLIAQLARSGSVLMPVLSPEAIFGGPAG
jgi:chemotaxis signal transduction protein